MAFLNPSLKSVDSWIKAFCSSAKVFQLPNLAKKVCSARDASHAVGPLTPNSRSMPSPASFGNPASTMLWRNPSSKLAGQMLLESMIMY